MAHGTREDWQAGKSVIECNKYMFLKQLYCDVTFRVGMAGKEIKAHKYVLASRSNVFEAGLFGHLLETSDVIDVPDIEAEIFDAMMRFLYFEEAEINENSVIGILYAAEKYGITELLRKCQFFLETHIIEDNICIILENALLYNMDGLFQKCQNVIYESLFVSRKVFESQSFLDLSKHCLCELVQSDRLPLDERAIFDSLLHWAKEQCIKAEKDPMDPSELRRMLGDLLHHVRFPLMTSALFKEDIVPMKILSDEEVNEISDHFIGQRVQNAIFKKKERNMVMNIYRIHRESTPTLDWNSNGEMDAIDFEANKAFQLHGILLFGSSGSYTYVVEVRISSISDGNRCLLDLPPFTVSGEDQIFEIKFDKPCNIAPSQRYQISVIMKGQKKSFSAYFCDSYTHCDFTIKFYDSAYRGNGTNASHGQIPGLICFIPK